MRASAPTGAADFSISRNGTLIYVPGTSSLASGHVQLGLTDRKGKMELLKLPPGPYVAPRVAPDGAHIAFGIDDGNEATIYSFQLSGASAMRRLTFGGNNRFPTWTANNRVAFQSDREGDLAIWQSVEGGAAVRLTKPEPGTSHVPESWSPQHNTLLFGVTKGADVSLWTYSLQNRASTPFGEVHSSNPTNAVFSPDGRWVAYTSTERNRAMTYVQPFPASGAQYELPAGAYGIASQPLWSPDGKELFYNPAPAEFAWVSVMTQPTITFGNPETVPRPFRTGSPAVRRAFDITPGGRFIGFSQEGQTESGALITPQIQVVLNWFEELRARVPMTK
jgi:Tol biopolymer transport system component